MIDITDDLTRAMRTKAGLAAEGGGCYDLLPIVVHYRDGRMLATVHACGGKDEDSTPLPLLSTQLAAAAWRTDELTMTSEVVVRYAPLDEFSDGVTVRQEPQQGALVQQLIDDPFADVHPALVCQHARRGDDDVTTFTTTYRYAEDEHGGVAVEWEPIEGPERSGGDVASRLLSIVNMSDDDGAHELWRRVSAAGVAVDDDFVARLIAEMFGHGVALLAQP